MLRATPSLRPISRALTPSRTSRNIRRIYLILGRHQVLLADDHAVLMPELLTQGKAPKTVSQVADDWSEPRRLQIGIPGRVGTAIACRPLTDPDFGFPTSGSSRGSSSSGDRIFSRAPSDGRTRNTRYRAARYGLPRRDPPPLDLAGFIPVNAGFGRNPQPGLRYPFRRGTGW